MFPVLLGNVVLFYDAMWSCKGVYILYYLQTCFVDLFFSLLILIKFF